MTFPQSHGMFWAKLRSKCKAPASLMCLVNKLCFLSKNKNLSATTQSRRDGFTLFRLYLLFSLQNGGGYGHRVDR